MSRTEIVFRAPEILKRIFTAIAALTGDNPTNAYFEETGLVISTTDCSTTAMVQVKIPNTAFATYRIVRPFVVGLYMKAMVTYFGMAASTAEVVFGLSDDGARFQLSFRNKATKAITADFSLVVADVDQQILGVPDPSPDAIFLTLSGQVLCTLIGNVTKLGEQVTFETDTNGLWVSTEGEGGSARFLLAARARENPEGAETKEAKEAETKTTEEAEEAEGREEPEAKEAEGPETKRPRAKRQVEEEGLGMLTGNQEYNDSFTARNVKLFALPWEQVQLILTEDQPIRVEYPLACGGQVSFFAAPREKAAN